MRTKETYSALLSALESGYRAVVLSKYSESGIAKAVCREDEPDGWAQVDALLTDPAVIQDGPVTQLKTETEITVIEQYAPKPRMIILGGGHIALALVKMAKLTDFYTVVFDDRPMYANPERFPEADEVICDDFSRVFSRLKIRTTDYVVIVTRGHKHDTECLEGLLAGIAPTYTGMIGSRRRVAIVLKQLESEGYPAARLDEIYTPIGLKIGAVTPAEISVAILAEIIEVKRKGKGLVSGLTSDVEIVEWLAGCGDEADALITILETHGSVPRDTGAKMAMTYEGKTINTIGGGCAESDVMQQARTVIREGGFRILTVDMTDTAEEDGMVCGGTMQVLVESTKGA
ncbi:MAG: XdhC family protein [Clostridiales Family XIII bacterium]|jgi:xanthine dehydrogenase accessory factor|nr:XdhC family protein [Clostridiales Family XIII bacterium]